MNTHCSKLNLAATSKYDQRTVVYALEYGFGYVRQEALVVASVIIAATSKAKQLSVMLQAGRAE